MALTAPSPIAGFRVANIQEGGLLVDYAAQKRKKGKAACYVHVRGATPKSKFDGHEMVVQLRNAFKSTEGLIVGNEGLTEFIGVIDAGEDQCKGILMSYIYKSFSSNVIFAMAYPLIDRSCEQLSRLLDAFIPAPDYMARIGWRRFNRRHSSFLVIDDDPMVLRQIEQLLGQHGQVICTSMAEEFLSHYKASAPNAVFLDIHLKMEKGTDLGRAVRHYIDPFAHIVIMSSDTGQETLQLVKGMGANGFVPKPLAGDKIARVVAGCPTVIPKSR